MAKDIKMPCGKAFSVSELVNEDMTLNTEKVHAHIRTCYRCQETKKFFEREIRRLIAGDYEENTDHTLIN